jgi:uncharacterized membrane protein YbaN (DUF454 family)
MPEDKSLERKSDFDKDLLPRSRIKRALYFIAGSLCLTLGIIGIVIPILPTTPFLLLAAACYASSSEKAYNWMLNNKVFGRYIRDYREGKGLPVKIRIFIITFLWITIIISIIFIKILWVQVLLLIIAILVSIHVALIRPKKT